MIKTPINITYNFVVFVRTVKGYKLYMLSFHTKNRQTAIYSILHRNKAKADSMKQVKDLKNIIVHSHLLTTIITMLY